MYECELYSVARRAARRSCLLQPIPSASPLNFSSKHRQSNYSHCFRPAVSAPSPRMGPGASAFASPGGMALAVAAAGAGGGAGGGGRGSGPDHREVRYQDGVLSMINTLRQLALGGPRTWDYQTYQQVSGGLSSTGVADRPVPQNPTAKT
jgi:hypothetical protein